MAGFPRDPRMTPRGIAFNRPGVAQPQPPTPVDILSKFAPPSRFGPPPHFMHTGAMHNTDRTSAVHNNTQYLPHAGFAGGPRNIPCPPHFQPLPLPHHFIPLPQRGPPGPPVPLSGANISSVGPPRIYFPPPVPVSPILPSNFPPHHYSPFAPRGPNIPSSDPTDVFLNDWLSKVTAGRPDKEQEDRPMKIPEAQGLLSHAQCILSSLRVCHAQLVELDQRGERGGEQWSVILSQVEGLQKELVDIRDLMERGDNVQRLSRKLAAIKKKRVRVRERAKRRRREMNEEKERNEKRAEEWMTQKRQERLKEETERCMQSDAGGVLGEVKRKISDVQHYTKLVSALKELRNHRREAHKKTGEAPLIEEDDFFSSETDRLCEVLKQRMTLYEEEEHALRVMVREEVEERMLAESAAKESEKEKKREEEKEGEGEVVDSLKPFLGYYLQAENSVEALVNIRRSWDMYVSADGSPLPNQLPHISQPSSSLWTEYCTTQTN